MSNAYEANGVQHVVKLSGPLNVNQEVVVTQRFRSLAAEGVNQVMVDLSEVPFIDSRGLAALVAGYQLFGSAAPSFQLTGLQRQPQLLFELTGFDNIFHIVDGIEN